MNNIENIDIEKLKENENIYFIPLRLRDEVKETIKNFIRDNDTVINNCFKDRYYHLLHRPLKLLLKPLLDKEYNIHLGIDHPLDFALSIMLSMSNEQIDSLHETFINFERDNFFQCIDCDYSVNALETCCCNKDKIKNISILQNKITGKTLSVGCDCIKKHKLLSKLKIKELEKEIDKKKEEKLNKFCHICNKYSCKITDKEKNIVEPCCYEHYEHKCKYCDQNYETNIKNPSVKECSFCYKKNREEHKKLLKRKKKVEQALLLKELEIGTLIEFQHFTIYKNNYDNYEICIKDKNTGNFIKGNTQLYKFIERKEIIPKDLNFNKYNVYEIPKNITYKIIIQNHERMYNDNIKVILKII
jgi:hypothetical protein